MAKALDKEKFLAAAKNLPSERVAVPEFGGEVVVRGMSAKERLAFEKTLVKADGKPEQVDQDALSVKLLVRCMVDDKGDRLLADEDAPFIEGLRGDVFQRLVTAAFRVNGYSGGTEGN
jgi:hypothetical protein